MDEHWRTEEQTTSTGVAVVPRRWGPRRGELKAQVGHGHVCSCGRAEGPLLDQHSQGKKGIGKKK